MVWLDPRSLHRYQHVKPDPHSWARCGLPDGHDTGRGVKAFGEDLQKLADAGQTTPLTDRAR